MLINFCYRYPWTVLKKTVNETTKASVVVLLLKFHIGWYTITKYKIFLSNTSNHIRYNTGDILGNVYLMVRLIF